MTHAEAFREFDEDAIRKAAWQEMESNPNAIHDENSLWGLCCKAGWEESNEKSLEQAHDLWQMGWTSEVPNPSNSKDFWRQCHTMSLYWRAPSKRPGKPGRRYLSTNQAWRAMKRASGEL